VLEYDREGDVTREERCEDTEYFEPAAEPKTTCTPFDGWMQFEYPMSPTYPPVVYNTGDPIDPAFRQPATCGEPDVKTTPTAANKFNSLD
jgi:hypothetical protein